MEDMIVNELSLNGQFENVDDFEKNLNEACNLFDLHTKLKNHLFFSSMIYGRKITDDKSLSDYLSRSHSDEARSLKIHMTKNFWDEEPQHTDIAEYTCKSTDLICGNSLAEAYERFCCLFSFEHKDFTNDIIVIKKNCKEKLLKNYIHITKYINDNFEDIIHKLWEGLCSNFSVHFNLLLRVYCIKYDMKINIEYHCSSNFKKQITNIPTTLKIKAIEQIVKRLSLTREQASINVSLNDEPIRGLSKNESKRRFYITKSQGRIHYSFKDNILYFESLNLQHDDELP